MYGQSQISQWNEWTRYWMNISGGSSFLIVLWDLYTFWVCVSLCVFVPVCVCVFICVWVSAERRSGLQASCHTPVIKMSYSTPSINSRYRKQPTDLSLFRNTEILNHSFTHKPIKPSQGVPISKKYNNPNKFFFDPYAVFISKFCPSSKPALTWKP